MMIPTGGPTTRILGVDSRAGHKPRLLITYRPIEHIQPSSKNPRLHSDIPALRVGRPSTLLEGSVDRCGDVEHCLPRKTRVRLITR